MKDFYYIFLIKTDGSDNPGRLQGERAENFELFNEVLRAGGLIEPSQGTVVFLDETFHC